jgi:regulatory protein
MAGQITSLQRQKRNPERVNVYLDGVYAFALPALEAVKLRREQHLSDPEIEALKTLDLRAKAYDKAVGFLQKEILAEVHIEWVIDKLLEQGYLNDDEFARYWVEQRNQFKPISPRALRFELRRKGIADQIIEPIIEGSTDAESAAAQAARSQRWRWRELDEETFRKKMAAFLQRRGFSWGVVREVLDASWQEMQESEES